MPQKHEYFTYKFEELTEAAQAKAVEAVADKLAGDWWDQGDTDDVGDVIRWTLAEKFGTPGWDRFGPSDYPGIPDVDMQGWDCDRAQSIDLKGSLTRDNAPALPWVDGIKSVGLRQPDQWRHVLAVVDEDREWPETLTVQHCRDIEDAVQTAMSEALAAGSREIEYKSSEESARDCIDVVVPDFHEDGRLA